jgi:hypothetical protein
MLLEGGKTKIILCKQILYKLCIFMDKFCVNISRRPASRRYGPM